MNANERLQRGRGDRFEPRAGAGSSKGSGPRRSSRSATRPGMMRRPATDRQDPPIANVAPTNAGPAPAHSSALLRDDARDDRQSRGVVDSGEEAQRTEGEREERNRRARRDAYHGNRDPRRAQE